MLKPKAAARASTHAMAAGMTSRPMPSPAMTSMVYVGLLLIQRFLFCRGRPRRSGSAPDGDGDVLGLQVLLDAETSALAAETGLLDPAEGRRGRGHDPAVEAHHSDLERLADGEG